MIRTKEPGKSALTELIRFARTNGISAIFKNRHGGKTVYYLTKPKYESHDDFEDELERLQHQLFPENNTIIFCTPQPREDRIWEKSERLYWGRLKKTNY